jgi:predicted phosphodiesterase
MRIAIFSDTHGNSIALDAVLAAIDKAGGVDGYWFVGDAAALGHDPAGTVSSLASIPGLVAVRGNTDRYIVDEHLDQAPNFAAMLNSDDEATRNRAAMMIRGMEWARDALAASGGFNWVAALPTDARVDLPGGIRVLIVHASPGTDDGPGLRDTQSDDEVRDLIANADADVIVVGHTHLPIDRTVDGVRIWNLGSVSMPFTDDVRAMWTLLEADESGYRLERHYAPYDVEAMLAAAEAVEHPAIDLIRRTWDKG